jgi:hypothetical protein
MKIVPVTVRTFMISYMRFDTAAMKPEEIAKVLGGVVLLPMTAGKIVLAYNRPGNPKGLKLPRDVYPDIFLGKITRWDDPRIQGANPGHIAATGKGDFLCCKSLPIILWANIIPLVFVSNF